MSARIRRSKEESRALILDAAETILRAHGPEAVNVRAVAAAVGLTDAAVNYHFGTRAELMEALIRHGGRKLKAALSRALAQWADKGASVDALIDVLCDCYADGGLADLAVRLHMSGWRDRGGGLLDEAVEALHAARVSEARVQNRPPPRLADTQNAVAFLHQAVALDPLFGTPFRRSAGLGRAEGPSLAEKKRLWRAALRGMIEL